MRPGCIVLAVVGIAAPVSAKPPPPHLAAWDAAWRAARGCLVGDPQLAADPGTAFSLHELRTGKHACEVALRAALEIARAAADDDAGYHVAWLAVFDSLAALDRYALGDTGAQGIFVSYPQDTAEAIIDRELPPIDAAVAAMHPGVTPVPTAAEVTVLALGDVVAGVPEGNTKLVIARDGALVFDGERRDANGGRVVMRGPDRVEPLEDTMAAPDRASVDWIRAGQRAAGRDQRVVGEFSRDDLRAVVSVSSSDRASLVTSSDRGVHWSKPAVLGDGKVVRVFAELGASALVWEGPPGAWSWQVIAGVKPGARHVLHDQVFGVGCAFDDALWWSDQFGALHASDAAGDHDLGTRGNVVGCTLARVLVVDRGGPRTCDRERCDAPVQLGYAENVATWFDESGKIATARQVSGVFEVISGGRTRVVRATEPELVLVAGVSWGGATYLAISKRWEGLHLVKVPE